jgi:hypothetical protein
MDVLQGEEVMTCDFCGNEFTEDKYQGVIHHVSHCENPYCVDMCDECRDLVLAITPEKKYGRPIYETNANYADEKIIIDAFCLGFNMHAVKTPHLHPYDYEVYEAGSGELNALVEVKRRNVPLGAYKEIFLSKQKVDRITKEAFDRGVPFLFVVQFDDAITYCKVFDPVAGFVKYEEKTGGRTDRDDPKDIEFVYAIPRAKFIKF